jgi:hypothetical protein
MCNSVFYCGREYKTPAELAVLVGGTDKLVWGSQNPFVNWPADKDWHATDLCLCPIDLAATLANGGFKWTRGVDPMEWFVTDPSPQTPL